MRYPIFIEAGTADSAFGVVVPDLPGCFSAGDTLDEALDNAREAVALLLESTLDAGGAVPQSSTVEPDLDNRPPWVSSFVEVDSCDRHLR